jgi:hypothetical protein
MEELTKYDKAKKRFIEIKRELLKIENEIEDIRTENAIIFAKLQKDIWSSKEYDEFEYNNREKIRQSDMTLKLNDNLDYKNSLKKIRELESDRTIRIRVSIS